MLRQKYDFLSMGATPEKIKTEKKEKTFLVKQKNSLYLHHEKRNEGIQ